MKLCECTTSPVWSTSTRRTPTAPEPCRRSRAPRRGRGRTWCCSPTTTRSRRSGTARRAGTATCCCSPARRSRRSRRDHYLAFGIDDGDPPPRPRRVRDRAGGAGRRRLRLRRPPVLRGLRRASSGPGMPFGGLDCDALHGIELWNFANDTGEQLASIPAALRFLAMPARVLDHPPERNMRALGRAVPRRGACVAIGGLDAHQYGKRIGPFVPRAGDGLPPLASATSARTCSASEAPTRELERDRELVYDALREGRCYIAVDAVAPARGFRFEAADVPMGGEAPAGLRTLHARTPLPARLRLLRDGTEIAAADGTHARRGRRGAGRLPRGGAPRPRGAASAPGSSRTRSTCADTLTVGARAAARALGCAAHGRAQDAPGRRRGGRHRSRRAGGRERQGLWLCKPGQKANPCEPSLTTTIFSPSGKRLGVEHVRRAKRAPGGLLLRLSRRSRTSAAAGHQGGGRRAALDRALADRALLARLPRLRARLSPGHDPGALQPRARVTPADARAGLRRRASRPGARTCGTSTTAAAWC